MKIEDFSNKFFADSRPYSNNIFNEEPDPAVIEFKTRRGLRGLHYDSDKGDKNLIIVPAMGRHAHDQRLCKFFSSIGYFKNVSTFDFAGTYHSLDAGEFLPNADGKLSVQEDLEDVIDLLHHDEPVEILGPCFGGAVAVQVAAERPGQVKAVYLFAPMLYGSEHKRYTDANDKSLELGKFKTYPRYKGTEAEGWYENVWIPLIKGETSLNSHKAIPKLAANARIYGVACKHDNLISSRTLEDFAASYISQNPDAFFYIYEDTAKDRIGHFGHYALEYAPGTMKSFCQFIGKDPKEVIPIKKQTDITFSRRAQGKLPIDDKAEERAILSKVAYLAENFYLENEDHLRQIVKAEPSKIRQFALGFIKGIIL